MAFSANTIDGGGDAQKFTLSASQHDDDKITDKIVNLDNLEKDGTNLKPTEQAAVSNGDHVIVAISEYLQVAKNQCETTYEVALQRPDCQAPTLKATAINGMFVYKDSEDEKKSVLKGGGGGEVEDPAEVTVNTPIRITATPAEGKSIDTSSWTVTTDKGEATTDAYLYNATINSIIFKGTAPGYYTISVALQGESNCKASVTIPVREDTEDCKY